MILTYKIRTDFIFRIASLYEDVIYDYWVNNKDTVNNHMWKYHYKFIILDFYRLKDVFYLLYLGIMVSFSLFLFLMRFIIHVLLL